ncbi:PAS domain S-box-containing protein/diguanylate cyclase (GGDEF)-like protein [Paenibacillus taihuensis]|uniref:PAS domain S-box-containing protein/diguanylate cyclase (GGDEF)-like protein n=1 Tax=Paenibacillus taihuensis TaxID=1156355 RepID=A0A3D9RU31_9BACL|nr:diguanylate cyclase [Paenibacillus taihuensis]REE80205.1 PAS domain S-box-containing protein/diguanylate cyclase (GGDEF)-like protein [Paenibacillus taihuensis]
MEPTSHTSLSDFDHLVKLNLMREKMIQGQRHVLKLILKGEPLGQVLDHVIEIVEDLIPGWICSIMLLDQEKKSLYVIANRSLPQHYVDAVNGSLIGTAAGSCGTAAYRNETVIVHDIAHHPYWEKEKAIPLANGLRSCWSYPLRSSDQQVHGTFAIYQHVTAAPGEVDEEVVITFTRLIELVLEQTKLRLENIQNEQRYKCLFENNTDSVCSFNLGGYFLSANQVMLDMLGYTLEGLHLRTGRSFVVDDDAAQVAKMIHDAYGGSSVNGDIRIMNRFGRVIPINMTLIPIIVNEKIEGLFGIAKDFTRIYEQQAKIQRLAYYDLLTGLPNRRMLMERLSEALTDARAAERERTVSLIYLDIDHFKDVNDRFGHHVGDALLQQVAERLNGCIDQDEIAARMGGDEFTILLSGEHSADRAVVISEAVLRAFEEPLQPHGVVLTVTPSIGIATSPQGGYDVDTLIRNADTAMYAVKTSGRRNYHIY